MIKRIGITKPMGLCLALAAIAVFTVLLEWTLALIDEDVELYGNPFVHALAWAGAIDYAERRH